MEGSGRDMRKLVICRWDGLFTPHKSYSGEVFVVRKGEPAPRARVGKGGTACTSFKAWGGVFQGTGAMVSRGIGGGGSGE